jgi:protein O-GlcNAc transferase
MPSAVDRQIDEAMAHHQAGRLHEAESGYRKALAQQPNHPEALHFLGLVLHQLSRSTEALDLMRRSVAAVPANAMFHYNLGKCLREQRRFDESLIHLSKAIELKPDIADGYSELAQVWRTEARLDEAIATYRKAIAAGFTTACASGLLHTLWFHPGYGPQAIYKEHRAWAQRFADPVTATAPPHDNDRNPDRPLRIGYVSPDLRDHVLGRYIEPVFAAHDRAAFEIFCYSDAMREDALSDRLRVHAAQWHKTRSLNHDQLAQLIRRDRIDILVDLSCHMANNRLLMFARKPAPVQMTYLGYPATTGLSAMDYCMTDIHLDPPGQGDDIHSEKLIRLLGCYWCYPVPAAAPEVGPLPAARTGSITFGSFNGFIKVNADLVRLWARILSAVPSSRLKVLLPGDAADLQKGLRIFRDNGIEEKRLEFLSFRPIYQYLQLYNDIDITLDSHPYNGHTTSLDSLWMGVPIVTLAGQAAVSRAGVSFLTNLDLADLIATTADQYIQIATSLAQDLPRLTALRSNLREKMRQSSLLDYASLTSNLEFAYRQTWQRWCAAEPPAPLSVGAGL